MGTYQATEPPEDATCDTRGCGSVARVRLLIPKSRFEADGVDHDQDPPTFDVCQWHWLALRDACLRNGHAVVDATGDVHQLAAEFPTWTVFTSDGGRLYASPRVTGTGQGTTLDALLVGQLRTQMRALEDSQTACHG
jgi:hypothetical protein